MGRNLDLSFFISNILFLKHSNNIQCIKNRGMGYKLYLRNWVQSRFPCGTPSQVNGRREGEVIPSQHKECALSFPVRPGLTAVLASHSINYCLLLLNIEEIGLYTRVCSFVSGFCHSAWPPVIVVSIVCSFHSMCYRIESLELKHAIKSWVNKLHDSGYIKF